MSASSRPRSHPLLILAAVCLAGFAMPLSFTGPAVATPAIGAALGGSPIALNWITNAFMLVFGSSLMAAGALADAYGRKRVFLLGNATFAVTALAAAFAPGIVSVDVLRALQGIGGAGAFAGGVAAMAQEFEGTARMRAFSLLGTTFGTGLAFGPVLAGGLIELFGWRAVFLSVTTFSGAALVVGSWCMHESRDPGARGLDTPGALSFTAALTVLTYGFLLAPDAGWNSRQVIGLLVAGLILLWVFVLIENRVSRPMLDLSLFRYPRFVGAQFLAAAPAYSYVVLVVLLPIRFIGIEHYSAAQAGQMMIALSAPMVVIPVLAGMLTRWLSAGLISGFGLLVCAGGLIWLGACPPGTPVATLILPMLVIGCGVSLPWGLMDGLAVSVVPKERAGMAAGIFNTTRVAGEGIALAVVGAILAGLTQSHLRHSSLLGTNTSLAEAAHRLSIGQLQGAVALLPGSTPEMLAHFYGDAFRSLLYILAGITVATAVIVFAFLSQPAATVQGESGATHPDEARNRSVVPAEVQAAGDL